MEVFSHRIIFTFFINKKVLQVDRMMNTEPPRKHKFTAGFGLAHFTTMLLVVAMHYILTNFTKLSNSTQVRL